MRILRIKFSRFSKVLTINENAETHGIKGFTLLFLYIFSVLHYPHSTLIIGCFLTSYPLITLFSVREGGSVRIENFVPTK
jgi:hypothetical protein